MVSKSQHQTDDAMAPPDLEELAAYVDDRLSAEDRARVELRLAEDEDYYDVFLETVQFLEEEAAEEPDGRAASTAGHDRSGGISGRVAGGLAAAALVVLSVGVLMPPKIGSSPYWQLAELDSQQLPGSRYLDEEGIEREWFDPGVSVPMGRQMLVPDGLTEEELAFRLGLRTIELWVALGNGDPSATMHGDRLSTLAGKLGGDFVALEYAQLASETAEAESTSRAADLRLELVEFLESKDVPKLVRLFELAEWSEATRLAALTGDRELMEELVEELIEAIPEGPGSEELGRALAADSRDPERLQEQLVSLNSRYGR